MKRSVKFLSVLLCMVLMGLCFALGNVGASDCEHTWSKWTGRDGQHRRECTLCGSVDTGICDYRSILLRPTCTEGGHTEKTCKYCGDFVIADEKPAVGHTWNDGEQTLARPVWMTGNGHSPALCVKSVAWSRLPPTACIRWLKTRMYRPPVPKTVGRRVRIAVFAVRY